MLPDEDSSKRLQISQRLSASEVMMKGISEDINKKEQLKGLQF
jgi:hypothetical protein